jgi:hypothetical protein
MLIIKNIDKVMNMTCYGRQIYNISTHRNKIGEESYVFEFDAIEDGQVPTGYNKPKEIHLVRNEYSGTYRLFCMGLQVATERRIDLSEIKCLTSLLVEISEVLRKTKYWWEHSKTN